MALGIFSLLYPIFYLLKGDYLLSRALGIQIEGLGLEVEGS